MIDKTKTEKYLYSGREVKFVPEKFEELFKWAFATDKSIIENPNKYNKESDYAPQDCIKNILCVEVEKIRV